MEITIRRLAPVDADTILAAGEVFDHPILPDQLAAFLASPLHLLVAGFEGGRMVCKASATVLLHPDKPPQLFVNEVDTLAGHRRRGIAGRVVAALLEEGWALGCRAAWLATEADNLAARALYRRLGGGEEEAVVVYDWEAPGAVGPTGG